ncbi:glycerol kinase GlpK [Streptomyces sp. B1866]|uniref:glycerol kinase GlpK n=1 Tax=Streptomyces sp. B1866 TaxID=3075431 RepID=UPI002891FB81|nr:glycerol kinase GlpK [Streptomyces sp. B1866]MDT3396671.1 glycerol kinase GlpK [Streptomyces sp. B1866]
MTDTHGTGSPAPGQGAPSHGQGAPSHGQGPFIAAIDQGTTSSRCIVFDRDGRIVSVDQKEHRQIFPKPGWVEHDATEIWENVQHVMDQAIAKAKITSADVRAIGITNQRETTLLWDRTTGEPVHHAIVWQDTRTDALCRELGRNVGQDRFRRETGLPLASYFAGPKIRWLLDNVPGLRERAEAGEILFGTMDSWVIWNLTGGVDGGVHVTDVTNASRTLLMNLHTLDWDERILSSLDVPAALLPEIRSSSEVYGTTARGVLAGVPVASALGDQQAALFGQTCFAEGEAKSTYGTGTFLLMNTGGKPVNSYNGLVTTVGYRIGDERPVYALEGSIAVTGALVQWMRDQMGLIKSAAEIETLASSVEDNGGAYVVPAFSGLFAPYWRSDARGVIAGLTRYVTKAHLARAVLEATAWQTREIVDAMTKDSGVELAALKVDGGMTSNNLLMQTLSDVLDAPVVRPMVAETTCLGAAYAAGLAVGFWPGTDALRANWRRAAEWTPRMAADVRAREYGNWLKAVERTMGWTDNEE